MADSSFPSEYTHLSSSDFVIAAGCVLFRKSPKTGQLQLCLIYVAPEDGKGAKWLLPKGRKDLGESIATVAVRETFEETGYPCELLPCRMPTRATIPGVYTTDVARVVDEATEPVAVSVRNLGKDGYKFIWWFLAKVKENTIEKVIGTQMETENYVSEFFDVEEGIAKLTRKSDQDVAGQAFAIVEDNIKARGLDVMFP